MNKKICFISIFSLLFFSLNSHAGQACGDFYCTDNFNIATINMSAADNFHFRISGRPTQTMCANGIDWAYINENDSGAKGKIAGLMMGYSLGKKVGLLTETVVRNGTNFCHILDFTLSD